MEKWILWGIASFLLLVLFWPVGLAVLFIGLIRLIMSIATAQSREQRKQYTEDVHTIAEHIREGKK